MPGAPSASVPETTMRIGADELAKLVDITAETTRRTAEMPAVDLAALLCSERTPAATSTEGLLDLGDLFGDDAAEVHDTPLAWLEPPTEQKRLRIVFDATTAAFG